MLRRGSPLTGNWWTHDIPSPNHGPFSFHLLHRCLSSVVTGSQTSAPGGGNDIGGHVDALVKQVDERWKFIAKPEHMRGILQNDRHCQPTNRNLPKDVLLRFALAEDETGEAWVIPDTNAVYPGRGMRVLPSYAALEICAQAGSFTHSFKRNHVRLPLGIEDYVEAQLIRHTQLALVQALSAASAVKRIVKENRSIPNAERKTGRLESFSSCLDEAVSNSIALQETSMLAIDTSDSSTSVWLLNRSNRMLENSLRNGAVEVGWYNSARSFDALSDREILAAIELPEAERFRQSHRGYETIKETHLRPELDRTSGEESPVEATEDEYVIAIEGVPNNLSSRLLYAQFRLTSYRRSLVNAKTRGRLVLKARKNNKRKK